MRIGENTFPWRVCIFPSVEGEITRILFLKRWRNVSVISRSIRPMYLKVVLIANLWITEIALVTTLRVLDMGTYRIGLPHWTMPKDLAILRSDGIRFAVKWKPFFLNRFLRRLETEQSVTVPGRTLDTVLEMHSPSLSKQMLQPGEKSS